MSEIFLNLGHPELMRGGALPCTIHDINYLLHSQPVSGLTLTILLCFVKKIKGQVNLSVYLYLLLYEKYLIAF